MKIKDTFLCILPLLNFIMEQNDLEQTGNGAK